MKRFAWIWLLFIPFLASCNRETVEIDRSPRPVRVAAVELYTPTGGGQKYSASILPNRQVNLSFKVNGFVDSLYSVNSPGGGHHTVDIGDVVTEGTVLGTLRPRDYQLQVAQANGQMQQARHTEQTARAQLQQAEAAATKAEQDYERADALFKEKSLTKSDYDAAKANRDSTRAQVEAARSQVQVSAAAVNTSQATVGTASLALQDTSLAVPFTAAVVQRSVEIGTLAGPGLVAFVLADISSVKATFGVSDIVVSRLRIGSPLSIYTEAFPSHRFQGHVTAIAAVADSSTRSFQVEVTIPNKQGPNKQEMLRPGMIASLDAQPLPRSPQPVPVAPLDAIVPQPGESGGFAVIVVRDGIAHHRAVTLGPTYGDLITVSGIEPGTKVVSSGATFVHDGDVVQVIP